ncbi:MAG: flavodoxin domain-containing protein, partial [Oscillospiraceae bacterium]|nr:flavodoxin domain-containing protein [Oscillospiraceae bacterium]
IKFITKNYGKLAGKKLVLFAVGSGAGRADELEAFWEKALDKTVRENVPHFYLRSGLNYSRLGRLDKFMMDMLKKMLLKKGSLTEDEKGLLTVYETPIDFTDRENLKEILEFLN